MKLAELLDRCLYEDELREILLSIGERPEGGKSDMLSHLGNRTDLTGEILSRIDEELLTVICLESGVPAYGGKEQLVETVIEDVLGEMDHRTSVLPRLSREGGNGGYDGPEVDFWELLEALEEWRPRNERLPSRAMAEELSDFLVLRGFPAAHGIEPDCRVGGRIPVELVRGTDPASVDLLLEEMMRDLERYGCVVGIMYGLDDPTVARELEEAIDAVFEPEDRVAALLV